MLENCSKYLLLSSKTAQNIYCLAWLGLARLDFFLESKLLENAWLEFYFACSKSPNSKLAKNIF